MKVNDTLNIPKYCWQHLQTWGGQPFWVLWDRHHQGLWERLAAQHCSVFLGYTHTPKEAMAIWQAGSLEAVATYRGFIRELASSRGMHGPTADRAALRGVAKLPPHSHHNSSQNHSQAKGDASHHDHVSTEGRVPDRCSGRGWRRFKQHWGWKGKMLCLNWISRNRELEKKRSRWKDWPAQSSSEQTDCSFTMPVHCIPLTPEGSKHSRTRSLTPSPQLTLHTLHGCHGPHDSAGKKKQRIFFNCR